MQEKIPELRPLTEPIRPRRPILLSLLLWVFVLWTALGWLRFFSAINNRALILEFLPDWIYWYLVGAGLVWGLVGIPVIGGLLWSASWTRKYIPITALLYPLIYWVERLFFWQSTLGQSNWPFMLLLTVAWSGLVVWVMLSEKVRQYFLRKMKKD